MGWTLGGKKIGRQTVEDGYAPPMVVGEVACRNCTDLFAEQELLDSRCFSCRLRDNVMFKKRMMIRASYGSEASLHFPEDKQVEELL